jgi:S-adenosyl methyltransferase
VRPGIDTARPHPARMYDYFLGGKNHFAVDRETAEKALKSWGTARTAARENRAFLGRALAGRAQALEARASVPGPGVVL